MHNTVQRPAEVLCVWDFTPIPPPPMFAPNNVTPAQELLNAISQNTLQGRRDAVMLGLLLGCGLRRSEVVGLRLDQLQLRESH